MKRRTASAFDLYLIIDEQVVTRERKSIYYIQLNTQTNKTQFNSKEKQKTSYRIKSAGAIRFNHLYGLAKVSGQFLIAWSLSGRTSKAHR